MSVNSIERIRVYTFYVGKGDCHIIEFVKENGSKEHVLIDTGKEQAANILNFIKTKKIVKFKYVILTHFDSDHVGQFDKLIVESKIPVGNYLMRKFTADTVEAFKDYEIQYDDFRIGTRYAKIRASIKAKEGNLDKIIFPRRSLNHTFDIGDNLEIKFLSRYASFFEELGSSSRNQLGLASNNDSLVFTIRCKTGGAMKALMFMGDIRNRVMKLYNTDSKYHFVDYAEEAGFFTFPHHGCIYQQDGGNDSGAENKQIRDEFIYNVGKKENSAITFVSSPNNATILQGRTGTIYDYFDAIRMREKTKEYFRTSNLEWKSGAQIAMKYTVVVETGNNSVRTYPDDLLLYSDS